MIRKGDAANYSRDYVYFENSSSNPYLIRRIEELNKTANGNVEAKVVCFYRRRDISSTLIVLADKHASKLLCVHMISMQNFQTRVELCCTYKYWWCYFKTSFPCIHPQQIALPVWLTSLSLPHFLKISISYGLVIVVRGTEV
uniref:Metastasis associated 1 family member 3 n=1 Tax=Anser brachyrhynchus TaxID=132585 RepID=A0A8B9CZV7_9AVES